jgi:hypothetical protein
MSKLELQRWFLEFVISFSKVYTVFGIWDLGSANSLGSCNPSLYKTDEFSVYISTMKSLNILWKHSLSIITFEEKL